MSKENNKHILKGITEEIVSFLRKKSKNETVNISEQKCFFKEKSFINKMVYDVLNVLKGIEHELIS